MQNNNILPPNSTSTPPPPPIHPPNYSQYSNYSLHSYHPQQQQQQYMYHNHHLQNCQRLSNYFPIDSSSNYAHQHKQQQPNIDQNKDGRIIMRRESNLNELMVENTATFMDSPIHLLMNHHKNQRALKQLKQQHQQQHQQVVKNSNSTYFNNNGSLEVNNKLISSAGNSSNTLNVTSAGTSLLQTGPQPPPIIAAAEIQEKREIIDLSAEYKPEEEPNIVIYNKTNTPMLHEKSSLLKSGKFIALIFTSLIILSSIYLLEIFSCIIKQNHFNLMVFKLSSCLTSFSFVFMMGLKSSKNRNKKNKAAEEISSSSENDEFESFKYYNIFQTRSVMLDNENGCEMDDENSSLVFDSNEPKRFVCLVSF